jgi:hypothetical protein
MTRNPRWSEADVQDALTRPGAPFDYRDCAAVPNVSYGLRTAIGNCREVDLVVLKGKSFHGVEIKTNLPDLLRNKYKQCERFAYPAPALRFRWFAVPAHLAADVFRVVDPRCGVLSVVRDQYRDWTETVRPPTAWEGTRDPTPVEVTKFLRLGLMRYWNLRTRSR